MYEACGASSITNSQVQACSHAAHASEELPVRHRQKPTSANPQYDGYYSTTANNRITTGYCNAVNEWPGLE